MTRTSFNADFNRIAQRSGRFELWLPDYLSVVRGKVTYSDHWDSAGHESLKLYQALGFTLLKTHTETLTNVYHLMRLPDDYTVETVPLGGGSTGVSIIRILPDGRRAPQFWLKHYKTCLGRGEGCRRLAVWNESLNDYVGAHKKPLNQSVTITDGEEVIASLSLARYKGMEMNEHLTAGFVRGLSRVFCTAVFPGMLDGHFLDSWNTPYDWDAAKVVVARHFTTLADRYMDAAEADFVSAQHDKMFTRQPHNEVVWRRWLDPALDAVPEARVLFDRHYNPPPQAVWDSRWVQDRAFGNPGFLLDAYYVPSYKPGRG
ncbi:MAG: hypothetical protein H6865_06170 [Rhodospirillales bacterium]|nr:hypothetical protein [Alphaproteobacteria bacterium]MCB9987207.1 hypothetical protein [Rhodospirillales bacterium]USO07931.1 MAG: hypothetical protein H6866_01530 [Rhodospirillales bacterium]